MTTPGFKYYGLNMTKVSTHDIKKLKVKNYRINSYPLVPSLSKGVFLLPKKECLKTTKRFSFTLNGSTSAKQATKGLVAIKHTRPTQFSFYISEIYKMTDKLALLKLLTQNRGAQLKKLFINIEGGLIELEISKLLQKMLIWSPNMQTISLNLAKCAIKREMTRRIFSGLAWQAKLNEFSYNASCTDINNQEILDLVEVLSNERWSPKRYRAFYMNFKTNIRIIDDGIIALANFLTRLPLLTFKIDIIGTGTTNSGFKYLLDSLLYNKRLESFALHLKEKSNVSVVLSRFLQFQKNLREFELDISHDSQINLENFKAIQTMVAKLPKLTKYALDVDGCPGLGEPGTIYVAESLAMFRNLRELKVHFASFLDGEDHELVVLPYLTKSILALKQIQVLNFDLSSCHDWFMEADTEVQPKFIEALGALKELRNLSLNFKKSHITTFSLQNLQNSLTNLKHLKALELNLNFCKKLKEKDLKSLLLYLARSLRLVVLKIYADDISYDENKIVTDLEMAVKSSSTLKEMNVSLKKTFRGKQAAEAMAKFRASIPDFDLTLQGGIAFTVMLKPNVSPKVFQPHVKSRFCKEEKIQGNDAELAYND